MGRRRYLSLLLLSEQIQPALDSQGGFFYGVTGMIDCDPNSPCNQISNQKPWVPKRKRKNTTQQKEEKPKQKEEKPKRRTRSQEVRLLWARQNELSRL